MSITKEQFVRYIDHSLLKPNLTIEEIKEGCEYARKTNCVSVCVNTNSIVLAKQILEGSNTAVGTVIGFPAGAHTTYIKTKEAEEAYKLGATELDMVIDISALKSKNYDLVKSDIEEVVKATPGIVKVILEMCYLTDEEKVIGCKLSEEAGAHYVKTSTGFAHGGATLEDIKLMKNSLSDKMKIKAAGGIDSLEFSFQLIEAGCNRLGISRTKNMLSEY